MKILEANAGALTNFEVLDFLKSKGASKDPTRVLADVATSEYKVYDYLVETAACNQNKECISDFLEKSKKYDLAKAELLNIINIRPSTPAEIFAIIEKCEERFEDVLEEIVEMVKELLPPPTAEQASQEIKETEAQIDKTASEEMKGIETQIDKTTSEEIIKDSEVQIDNPADKEL